MALPSIVDVAIVGAGAAGLGAAQSLKARGLDIVVLEARDRVGGRAHTVTPRPGLPLDLGCGWLHSARRNSWTRIAGALDFQIDRSVPAWTRPALNVPAEDQSAWRRAFADFEARLEAAADQPQDAPASSLFTAKDARWRPLLDAFSGYYNGAPFEEISIQDYAAYQPTDDNWRVRAGYGALMTAFAADLPIALGCPVSVIDRRGRRLRLVTPRGAVEARVAVVCVPTTVIAHGGLRFDPDAPDKVEAAAALPLGHVDKAFLALDEPDAFEADTRVQARTDTPDTAGYTLRPMGLPVVEAFFGGTLAARLEAEGAGAFCAFAREELGRALGSRFARALTPLAQSGWGTDPFSLGAYSHARPGFAHMRAVLATPMDPRIFFAGEACSAHDFSTAHGAHDTGVAAARAAADVLSAPAAPDGEMA
jgi:monoamine oxidase